MLSGENNRGLSNNDYDGSKNVYKTMNSRPFKLQRVYLDPPPICRMQAIFARVELIQTLSRFTKRKENSSSYVHVLHKTLVSRRSRPVDVKEILILKSVIPVQNCCFACS